MAMPALNVVNESFIPRPLADQARRAAPERRPLSFGQSLYLIGRPTLKQFLRFVRQHAVEPGGEDVLIGEWQAGRKHIAALEKKEAGCADNPAISKIEVDSKYGPLLMEFLRDPLVRNGFNTVPTEIAWVELDRLVVYQKHIDLSYVRELQHSIGPEPSGEVVFRTCLPCDHPRPPAKWSRTDEDSYVFVSSSNDLRFLGAMPLEARHIRGCPHPGTLLGVVGLAVGFGSNLLNAIWADNRLVLNNGSHRAYALRALGFTHLPCVVQHAPTREELEVVAPPEVRRDPDRFLRNPRPPLLKDYFDARLIKVMPVQRLRRQVELRFSVSEYDVPAL